MAREQSTMVQAGPEQRGGAGLRAEPGRSAKPWGGVARLSLLSRAVGASSVSGTWSHPGLAVGSLACSLLWAQVEMSGLGIKFLHICKVLL